MHLEQVKKHEHNLGQQQMMLASLEVEALRALVAETKEAEEPPIQSPLPAPREPPPDNGEQIVPSLDLEMEATPLDSDDDGMEDILADRCFYSKEAEQSSSCYEAEEDACLSQKR